MPSRLVAAALAGLLAIPTATASAAPPPERAAEPFPIVPLPEPPARSHRGAALAIAGGAGLIAGSFVLHERANRSYRDYLDSTDPAALDDLYDRAAVLDRWSAATLIAGEVLLATGVYLRFLRDSPPSRLALGAAPGGVALRWRF